MGLKYADLISISMKLDSPKIFPLFSRVDLKKVKEFYFKAKEIFLSIDYPDNYEIEVMIEIFDKGVKKVSEFFTDWRVGKIQPTDEELDLLLEACDEASNNFNILSEKFPTSFSAEDNQKKQDEIARGKKLVLEEKRKRANNDAPNQQEEEAKRLQSQLNSLKNQPNNSDNEDKIRDLQRQIEELKKNKPNSPSIPNPNVPQQSTKNDDNNGYLIRVFCLGFGACLVLVIVLLVKKSKKKVK